MNHEGLHFLQDFTLTTNRPFDDTLVRKKTSPKVHSGWPRMIQKSRQRIFKLTVISVD